MELEKQKGLVKEKGRKKNYSQFNLLTNEMTPIRRMLNEEEITSFLEISCRAPHCPMPLNCDVWDSIRCGFGCKYCFADNFRASLYSSFFDNSSNIGFRYCHPDYFKRELDKLMKARGTKAEYQFDIQNAIALQIPIRLGIRFENFLPIEKREKVSLALLNYLADIDYPIMINTKSAMIGDDEYLDALNGNGGGAAVHLTMNTSNEKLSKLLEPKAPTFEERIQAAFRLTEMGIRVVARIEPFMIFINDHPDDVKEWIGKMKWARVKHVTLDTYSYSAVAPGIKRQMELAEIDYERMFELMSQNQWLGSLILGKFMEELRHEGMECSTFDFGNTPNNSDDICCSVDDYFPDSNFSYGNTNSAIRFICNTKGLVTWKMFEDFVLSKGGWLSQGLKNEVFRSWNELDCNQAYIPSWGVGIEPCGVDENGIRVWTYREGYDYREDLLKGLIG